MSQDIIVIDDAVSIEYQKYLENLCLDRFTPYYFQRYTNYTAEHIFKNPDAVKDDTFQFTHMLFNNGEQESKLYPYIVPLISAIPFSIEQILRVKINLTVKSKRAETSVGKFCP